MKTVKKNTKGRMMNSSSKFWPGLFSLQVQVLPAIHFNVNLSSRNKANIKEHAKRVKQALAI